MSGSIIQGDRLESGLTKRETTVSDEIDYRWNDGSITDEAMINGRVTDGERPEARYDRCWNGKERKRRDGAENDKWVWVGEKREIYKRRKTISCCFAPNPLLSALYGFYGLHTAFSARPIHLMGKLVGKKKQIKTKNGYIANRNWLGRISPFLASIIILWSIDCWLIQSVFSRGQNYADWNAFNFHNVIMMLPSNEKSNHETTKKNVFMINDRRSWTMQNGLVIWKWKTDRVQTAAVINWTYENNILLSYAFFSLGSRRCCSSSLAWLTAVDEVAVGHCRWSRGGRGARRPTTGRYSINGVHGRPQAPHFRKKTEAREKKCMTPN